MADGVKLPVGELFRMSPGDRFVVYWAKDDNRDDIRLDHVIQTIASNDGKTILTCDGYEWTSDEIATPGENMLDTSRGYAYFWREQ